MDNEIAKMLQSKAFHQNNNKDRNNLDDESILEIEINVQDISHVDVKREMCLIQSKRKKLISVGKSNSSVKLLI